MANTDKNIVITPNIGSSSDDPKIVFSGADASTAAQNITLYTYPTDNGTLSFEGSSGQLFSITNSLSGTIFSVNDVSGIPSIEVDDDGTIRFAEFAGNVGIGIASPTEKLHVNGNILATGEVTAYSDARIKDNIKIVTDSLTKILSIRGVTFTRTDQKDTEHRQMGVIAQEVEEYFPEVVTTTNNGIKTVNYGAMAGAFIEAFKEQQRQIDELKEIIKTLK